MLMTNVVVWDSGCASTRITPVATDRTTVPFDGNEQTAGIIRDFPDHSSEITPSARARYNGLIGHYGSIFSPPINGDFGLTPMPNGNWNITAEGKEKWYAMKLERDDVTK